MSSLRRMAALCGATGRTTVKKTNDQGQTNEYKHLRQQKLTVDHTLHVDALRLPGREAAPKIRGLGSGTDRPGLGLNPTNLLRIQALWRQGFAEDVTPAAQAI